MGEGEGDWLFYLISLLSAQHIKGFMIWGRDNGDCVILSVDYSMVCKIWEGGRTEITENNHQLNMIWGREVTSLMIWFIPLYSLWSKIWGEVTSYFHDLGFSSLTYAMVYDVGGGIGFTWSWFYQLNIVRPLWYGGESSVTVWFCLLTILWSVEYEGDRTEITENNHQLNIIWGRG